ncbi:MAG: succinyl-diaminopimelate desuccinylase [Deltaproteobacteria bacterium]|nr:succinyl-diaminopimelate desuccinylase [Deltaproteobacteria bacterium]MBW2535532.1 succinyl-diaminopimelate desuccinylase [Deltaproteobacteria bacterium]
MTAPGRLAQTLLWLCETPSLTGQEGPLCDALLARVEQQPLAAPVRRFGNSLVVPVSRGTGGPAVALAGHLDVVPSVHDGPPRIDGDRLYGPGASDMKSGLALMVDLLETEPELCGGVDLTLVFYAREEGDFDDNELGVVLREDPELAEVELAVCLEPSDNKLSLGACGSLQAGLLFSGRAAHSARPWQGDNAIHRAGELLCELAALEPQRVVLDGLTYATVTVATLAEGGRSRNIVPDRFVLNVNHRFAPNQGVAEAKRDLERWVDGRAEIEWRDACPGALPRGDHRLIAALQEAGVEAVEPKQAWTDVAHFALHGVAAVNFGPGVAAQAHQRNEFTSLTKLERGRTILARWLRAIGAAAS